jgi:hypothetical protein
LQVRRWIAGPEAEASRLASRDLKAISGEAEQFIAISESATNPRIFAVKEKVL